MSRKRSTRAGREPRDIVMNGVTVVKVVTSEEAAVSETPSLPVPDQQAVAERVQELAQIKGMSEALAAAGVLDEGEVAEFEADVQREIDTMADVIGAPGPEYATTEEAIAAAEQIAREDTVVERQEDVEPVIERKSNGRALPDAPEASDDDEGLAAAVKQARQEELPVKPIGLYVAQPAETRRDSEPLTTVAHLIVPAQPSGLALIGTFASAACGATLFVDKARVTWDDFTGDTDVAKCGWCVQAEEGKEIPAYDRGKRRPVLPGVSETLKTRSRTRISADAGELTNDPAFSEALARLNLALSRMEGDEKWVPTAEQIAELRADLTLIQDANSRRNQLGLRERTQVARAPRSVGPRAPRPSSDGEGTGLYELRVSGKLAPTLFRSMDPVGPFVVGYRSAAGPHWIVRDVRITDGRNPDVDFAADKAGAMRYAQEECAKLSPDVQAKGRDAALKRIQANDANRRCR